jgi:hypothetical protein
LHLHFLTLCSSNFSQMTQATSTWVFLHIECLMV